MELSQSIVSALVGAILAGSSALGLRWLERRKIDAEVKRIKAETGKINAESDMLTSTRLIAELDRLAESNETLDGIVQSQREEIGQLRQQVLNYAAKEMNHAAENAALKARVAELELLCNQFPVRQTDSKYVAPAHARNEYDGNESTVDTPPEPRA